MGILSRSQLEQFRDHGFVRLEEAFPRTLARRCADIVWETVEEQRDDPSTWHRPVVRIGPPLHPAFDEAARSLRWVEAIHEVAGPLAAPTPWMGGTIPVRFPVPEPPHDDGWHIDGSYKGPDDNWWHNHWSRDRALLMLVLFSEVGPDDAPTRIRVGSQRYLREALLPYGDEGTLLEEMPPEAHACPLAHATGAPGDVYLCHPFLVHAAQAHRGTEPRIVAQPGVPWREGARLEPDP